MTRARRRLHLHVPVRYYHRANRSDDHGYGKPSRFLTGEVQDRCDVTRPSERFPQLRGLGGTPRRIEVSVDSLFE
jgi:DNA helicase-2/ATP-dependent DNA helicase PcrA